MKLVLPFAFGIALLLFSTVQPSCYLDNEEERFGATSCDTATVKFSQQITTLLEEKCVTCHKIGGEAEFAPLTSYAEVKTLADEGKLTGRTQNAAVPMPPLSAGGLMDDCSIQEIQRWVDAGAPNN